MAKKAFYDRLEDIPEADRADYVERNGRFELDVEGAEDVSGLKSALQKERDARKKLEADLKATVDKYKDLDPVKAREALGKLQELEDQELLDAGKVEELLQKRTERMRSEHENQLAAERRARERIQAELEARESKLAEVLIDGKMTEALLKAGVRKEALPFALLKGRLIWKLEEGNPVPRSGDNVIYGKNGAEPISMDEWAGGMLAAEAPFLFEESAGSGANNTQHRSRVAAGVVPVSDQRGINNNLESIAEGKVRVEGF